MVDHDMEREMEELRRQAMADPHFHGLGAGFQAFIDEHGIKPERIRPDDYSCCIGFSEKEQKWYGWSHRGIHGFAVGDQVEKGDCAYLAKDPNDYLDDMRRFYDDEDYHERTWAYHGDKNGVLGVWIVWTYNHEVPNVDIRGTDNHHFSPYPKEWGKGAWTAQTLEDCKQMALDYYEGVS